MTTPKRTALLTVALVAIFTGTMISTPIAGMIPFVGSVNAQGPPSQRACPVPNYTFNPGGDPPGTSGFCVDGIPCPEGTTGVSNGKCVDGPACTAPDVFNAATGKCDDGPACTAPDVFNAATGKCDDGPACISPAVLVGDKCVTTEDNKCPPGYEPTGTGQGICVVAPQCPPNYQATTDGPQGLCVTEPSCPAGFPDVNSETGKCEGPVDIANCPSAAPSTNPIQIVAGWCAVKPGNLQNP